jgi:hypothetical protein
VLDHLSRDAIVVQRLLGAIDRVSASGVNVEDPSSYGRLNVVMHARTSLPARWSIGPARDLAGIQLQLVGSQNTALIEIDDRDGNCHLTLPGQARMHFDVENRPADRFLERIADQLERGERADVSEWQKVCHALELTDATQRSCQRHRTIDLYHEQVTERETFKSVMAAGGCAMLLWVLAVILIVGLVDGLQLPLRGLPAWRLWKLALIAPLACFLGLQLLQLVIRKKPST